LESHLRENAAANVTVHHVALSDRAGTFEMTRPTVDGSNHGMATAFSALAPVGEKYSVPTARMDEQLARGVPDVVKLDVEGAELAAIRGMRGLLSSAKPPALIVEHNQITSRAAGFTAAELFREVVAMQPRYRFYWIGWRLRPIRTAEELRSIERQGNLLVRCED
jgi:FkbM family methyltransferase